MGPNDLTAACSGGALRHTCPCKRHNISYMANYGVKGILLAIIIRTWSFLVNGWVTFMYLTFKLRSSRTDRYLWADDVTYRCPIGGLRSRDLRAEDQMRKQTGIQCNNEWVPSWLNLFISKLIWFRIVLFSTVMYMNAPLANVAKFSKNKDRYPTSFQTQATEQTAQGDITVTYSSSNIMALWSVFLTVWAS